MPLSELFQRLDEIDFSVSISDPEQADCPLVYVNEAFTKLTGYDAEDILGRNCRFLQGQATDTQEVAKIRQEIETGAKTRRIIMNYRADGESFANMIYIDPLKLPSGKKILIGCQFPALDMIPEFKDQNVELKSDVITIAKYLSKIRDTRARAMDLRATNVSFMINSYMFRERLSTNHQR